MPRSGKAITWLHLSDVHLCKPKTGWDVHRVLRPLLVDLKRMQQEHGLCPDLMFFSGDLAFGNIGTGPDESIAEQLDDGHQFLESVRQVFAPATPPENVFIVPGNHDINRNECLDAMTDWLDRIRDVEAITRLIHTPQKEWKHIMLRLADYAGFLHRHGYGHLLDDPQRLTYAQIREVRGVRLGIAGLNSAWSSSRNNEKGKLWLGGDWQIGELTSQLQEVDLRIALIHHPGNWFREPEDPHTWQLIEREFQFCLHGHEHQGWVQHFADGHTRISAAAAYDRSGRENGYNLVRIDVETGRGEVWLRRYDATGGGWVPRIVANRTDNNGRWQLTNVGWLRPPVALTAGGRPVAAEPAVPPAPANAERARPAMGGDSISHVRGTAGTLGCLVRDRKAPHRVYMLSDSNTLCHPTDESFIGDAIVQPGRADGGTRATDLVGMLSRWTRVRDSAAAADTHVLAAIAEPRRGEEFSAEIRGRGPLKGVRSAREEMEVWIVARSGEVRGKVTQIQAKEKVPVSHWQIEGDTQSSGDASGFVPILFGDLIVCTQMLRAGDCGAILVDRENYALGMGFASGHGESFFFPIQRVLNALDVDLVCVAAESGVAAGAATATTPVSQAMPAVERPPRRDLIYISYSRRDAEWHRKLRKVLDDDDRLPVWDDTKIPPGGDWEEAIREHVARARIMIMLVSPDYLSPNCGAAEREITPALDAARKGELIILWIPVLPSDVSQHPIGKLMAAHDPARPLQAMEPAEQQKVLAGLRERIAGNLGISSGPEYRYDAFVSYRREEPDRTFAWKLVRELEAAGFRIALDSRDFSPQATFLEEMERCVKQSRFTLLVSSPRYFQSGNTQEEAIIAKVLDMAERRRRVIPLKFETTEMPIWLYGIVGIDFTEKRPFVAPMDRLVRLLKTPSPPKTEPLDDQFKAADDERFANGRSAICETVAGTMETTNHDAPQTPCQPSAEVDRAYHDPATVLADAGCDADDRRAVVRRKEVILLVHGIRTFAGWQPMVKRVLEDIPNTEVIPIKYGYLDALRFWCPFLTRQAAINELRREIQNVKAVHADAQISVIAHSFGTYAISQILLENPDIKFHRLILSGAIIPRSYRWDYVRGRLTTEVLNDYGTRDIWPVLAKCLSWGYGDTGRHGFGRAGVIDRGHNYAHSDFFTEEFVRGYWKPWFENGKYIASDWEENAPPPSWLLGILSVLPLQWILSVLLVMLIVWLGSKAVAPPARPPLLSSAMLVGNVAMLEFEAPGLPAGYSVRPQFSNDRSFRSSIVLGKPIDSPEAGHADEGLPAGIKPPCWVRLVVYDTGNRLVPNTESDAKELKESLP